MSLSLSKIEELAPDQGSLSSAKKLLKPSGWPCICEDGDGLLWGECQGSGATPYRISVTEGDAGYKCTCPSRKFPCKHSLALMWMRAEGKVPFTKGTAPGWVTDWLARRRGPSANAAATGPRASIDAANAEDEVQQVDPKAEARAAASRERSRKERDSSIIGGIEELDIWIGDQIDAGASAFASNPASACRTMAQRLVDAKAGGLAVLVDSMPSRLYAVPEIRRSIAAVRELGVLHLIGAAYRRQDQLAEDIKEDVRQMAGWNITRDALLSDPKAVRREAEWRVWLTRTEVQPDKLRRIETWLFDGEQHAVLIDYVPVSTGASGSGYVSGESFRGELVYYPSAVPHRALIAQATSGSQPFSDGLRLPERSLADAFDGYGAALALRPWIGEHPLFFKGARIRRTSTGLFLTDDGISLPVDAKQASAAWPLLQCGRIDGAVLWNGDTAFLAWLETDIGRWRP
ncbi:SWIM zinc finger family protein [Agrobacterium rubi]|nr:SWIM zinc finger family protein [Agrobacterium rubi]NTF24839.1 SWIM zinc finger family protein [Agrobacterium rubi]